MGDTQIEWTNKVWNCVRGCSRVSEGCRNCYAERQAIRQAEEGKAYFQLVKSTTAGPRWTGKVVCDESKLTDPLHWRKPARVFVNSMSDLFHESVPFEFIDKVFAVMACCPRHTFQILTKRPDRMMEYVNGAGYPTFMRINRVDNAIRRLVPTRLSGVPAWPLRNVWLGVSVEDQETADYRIPLLLQSEAAVKWISAEPLLGPINLGYLKTPYTAQGWINSLLCLVPRHLDWVVVGGESGPKARPMNVEWVRSIVAQCKTSLVPVFVKQLGSVPMESEESWRGRVVTRLLNARNAKRVPEGFVPLHFLNKKAGDIDEWPLDLRERQYPEVRG